MSSTVVVPESVERLERLGALRRVLENTDRIITGDPVTVKVEKGGPAPAWSNGAAITLNAHHITELDIAKLIGVHGLNYHELAHVIYTPRKASPVGKWLVTHYGTAWGDLLWQAFNILEDQRIETLLVARFPAVAPYLTATIARWILSNESGHSTAYALVRGRRYLPLEVREVLRRAFVDQSVLPDLCSVVDQYRALVFPTHNDEAKLLIVEFARIMRDLPNAVDSPCDDGPGAEGQAADGARQRADQAAAQRQDVERGEQEEGAEGPTEGAEGEQGNGGQEGATGAGETAGEAQGGEGTDSDDDEVPGAGGSGARGGEGETSQASVKDVLRDCIDGVENTPAVQSEMGAKLRQVVEGDGQYESVIPDGKYPDSTIPDSLRFAERRVRDSFRELVEECDPTWSAAASGKLNIQRAMRGVEPDELFDRWEEGTDGHDLEVVIAVDMSGSMDVQGANVVVSGYAWALTSALRGVGADVTTLAFGSVTRTVYRRGTEVPTGTLKSLPADGGTNPDAALFEAELIFRSSRRKNKLLIMVTDGVFDNPTLSRATIARLHQYGVLSAMAFLAIHPNFANQSPTKLRDNYSCGVHLFHRTTNPGELVGLAKEVVRLAIKRRGHS